jgi:hypothetical protein
MFKASLIFIAVASVLTATEPCAKEGQRRPGMWTYFWDHGAGSKNQCVDGKGQLVAYSRVTTNPHSNHGAKLVAQFPPVPVPDIAYFWYIEPKADESNPVRCIAIGEQLQKFTVITLENKPPKDARFVGQALTSRAIYENCKTLRSW